MSNFMVFDTEATSLNNPYCYDVGYVILDDNTFEVKEKKHFIIEQTWHNLPLFESAYYKEKRPIYIKLMRQHAAKMNKWGYVMRIMYNDIIKYNITDVYAYNSDFDDKVFSFNCDWYKCINPLDNVAIHDIWGYASEFITNKEAYLTFCEEHNNFTETGNYKGSAESVYQFITNNPDFIEEHIGLSDAEIESQILIYCLKNGAILNTDYEVKKIISRTVEKPFIIKIDGKEIYNGKYLKKYIRNDAYYFTTTEGI